MTDADDSDRQAYKPRLRPVNAVPVVQDGRELICVYDTTGVSGRQVLVSAQTFFILSRFDGEHTVDEIKLAYTRQFGELLLGERVQHIIEQLDEALLLESDRLRRYLAVQLDAYRRAGVRRAVHTGNSYPDDAEELRGLVQSFFTMDGGPGLPEPPRKRKPIRALVAPHIDFARGARGYAFTYKALAESAAADTYVVIGIAHQPSGTPFMATRNPFETPFGRVEIDAELLGRIEADYPGDLYADELLHVSEHSIEFQLVMLGALLGGKPFRIVPLLASSFEPFLEDGGSPADLPQVEAMVRTLRRAAQDKAGRICLIAAVDLAHVGNQFGDPGELTAAAREQIETADRESVAALERGDASAFFASVQKDAEERKVCGTPALYTMARAIEGAKGRLLHYEQAFTPEIQSMVSFASMVFA
ncbi:MAG: AmmeMemoRadiSam system protein B [Verrucomicrobia bacterium]|nr:AmmeMemoRadiSam system protein B [Verrucomicrobiota bacterium]